MKQRSLRDFPNYLTINTSNGVIV